ncbi:MAG: SH3 domain-containing protein [Candidatus Omnitrophota bacterium]
MNKRVALKVLICAVLVFCCAGISYAEDGTASPERLFGRGNDYYEKGEYQQAIAEYQKILDSGYVSGTLYYNMGDAYFKLGELGEAILNYERAMCIIPRDADLKANYKFAKANVVERPVSRKGIWGWRVLKMYSGNFTVNELTMLASVAYILGLILLFFAVSRPRVSGYLSALVVCLFLFTVFNVSVIWEKANNIKTGAVAIVPKADAFFGPFDTATKFFTLNEGVNVNIMKLKDDWVKIRRADGKIGWVKESEIQKI